MPPERPAFDFLPRHLRASVLLGLTAGLLPAHGGIFYDESSSGDLSSVFSAPTQGGALSLGDNSLSGSSVSADRDYITFNVPVGMALSAITLSSFVSTDDLIFVALTQGTTSIDPATAGSNLGSLLGYTHAGSANTTALVGTDILDDLAAGAGAAGFSQPLGPGDYTLWVQQTNPQNVSYGFNLTAVPEPEEAAWAVTIVLAGTAAIRFRNRQRS